MAEIRDELVLVDRFTNIFSRFIDLGSRAARQSADTQSGAEKMAASATAAANAMGGSTTATYKWTEAAGSFDKSALRAIYSIDELVKAGYLVKQSYQENTDAAVRATSAASQCADVQLQQADAAAALGMAQSRASAAVDTSSHILTGAVSPASVYASQLKSMERQVIKTQAALQNETESLMEIVNAHGAASAAAQEQAAKVKDLTEKLNRMSQQIEDTAAKMRGAEEGTKKFGDQAQNIDGKLNKLISKLAGVAAAFLSVKKAVGLVTEALSENTYELRFKAVMGDHVGDAAAAFGRQISYEMGRSTMDVYKQISGLNKLGASGQDISDMARLTDRLSWFSNDNDYSSMSSAIEQAFRTGNMRSISTQTGISKNLMEAMGVDAAIDSGDLTAFISALEKAADAAGLTEEALAKITAGPQAQWERFTGNIKNTAVDASSKFIEVFEPVFSKLNEWLDGSNGQRFFAGLSAAMSVAGTIAGYLVDALLAVGTFIGENFTTIMTIAGIALAVFAVQMLIAAGAALLANWPIILIIAAVAACVIGLQKLGVGAEEVFGVIGTGAGILYALLYNIIANIWNAIAAFAEFFANVFNDPLGSVARLFFSVFDSILGIVESVASAIDFLLGTDMGAAVAGFRNDMNKWVDETFGENAIKIERMAELDIQATAAEWGSAGAGLGEKVDNFQLNLDDLAPDLSSFSGYEGVDGLSDQMGKISGDTGKIAKNTANLADEDLKYLEDVTVRRYEAHVNTTSLTPSITVNVEGSADKGTVRDITSAIAAILARQAASHTAISYAEAGV